MTVSDDLRYAFRRLRGRPLFVLVAVSTLAHNTARRRGEIAIRMALGARPADVLRAVLQRVAILCAASGVVGLALSQASTRRLGGLLYGHADSAVYLLPLLLLGAVAAVACLLPATRAQRIDPASALRHE